MKSVVSLSAIPFILYANLGFSAPQYTIVVDAGSSGSRLYVYEYETSTAVPTITKKYASENQKPGLATFADKSSKEVHDYMKSLLDGAQSYLKSNGIDQSKTTINILGTAGMRILDPKSAELLYKEVRTEVEPYGFPIQQIGTISGENEGLYGWLDINYLLGNFQNQQKPVGSIEMGGASTQIAFATTETQNPNVFSFKIGTIDYSVFSKSFLGLGQDEALKSMIMDENSASCFPVGYTDKEIKAGAFNSKSCALIYNDMISQKIHSEDMPAYPLDGQFIAYSGIYYTFNFFENDKVVNQAALEAKIEMVCNKDWSELKASYPTVEDKYLSSYCAHGVYEDNLLFNTYKLQNSQLAVMNKVAGQSVEWTLGAVLYNIVKKS